MSTGLGGIIGGRLLHRLHLLQAAILVAGSQQAQQCVVHAVLLGLVAACVDGGLYELGGLYLFNLAHSMEGFLKILQICSSTGEYNTGEKFVLCSRKVATGSIRWQEFLLHVLR